MQRERLNADQKSRNSYSRLEDATKKIKELEETLDEQEKVLIKRHNEINSLLKAFCNTEGKDTWALLLVGNVGILLLSTCGREGACFSIDMLV